MRNFIKAAIAATALTGASLAAVQPAEARDHTGVAVAAGIIGLGVGAAIASSANDRPRYYDTGYQQSYYDNGGYYNYAPSYGVVYDRGYYQDRGYHRGWDRHDRRDWDRHDRHDWDHRDGWRR